MRLWLRAMVLLLLSFSSSAAVPPAPTGPRVVGLALDEVGQPLADASLELAALPTHHESGLRALAATADPPPLARARSDARGRFHLSSPRQGLFRLVARAPGRLPREISPLPLVDDLTLPDLSLPPAAPVEVRVVDSAGRPQAGAVVLGEMEPFRETRPAAGWRPSPESARTGADGTALLLRRPRESLEISVFAPGFAEVVRRTAGERLTVSLSPSDRGRAISLLVVDSAGKPLPGALVRLGERSWPAAETDLAGCAVVRLPAALPEVVRVSMADGRAGAHPFPAGAEAGEETLRLPALARLTGRVHGGSKPLAGAVVWSPMDPGRAVESDAAGTYRIAAPDGRDFRVRMEAAGHLGGGVTVGEPERRVARLPTVSLTPAVSLAGRAVDPAGRPLEGVLVEAALSSHATGAVERHRSGADGRFLLRRLAGGTLYELRAGAPGRLPAHREVATPATPRPLPPVLLTLAANRPVQGRVVDDSDRPVSGARVVLLRSSPSAPRPLRLPPPGTPGLLETVSGGDGKFSLPGLPAREIDLQVAKTGHAPAALRGLELPPGSGSWDLGPVVLARGVALSGRVVDRGGKPVAAAEIFRAARASSAEAFEGSLRDAEPEARSGADGRFTLVDLPAGPPVHLFVRASGYLPILVRGLVPPSLEPVTVRLEEGESLAGRVLDAAGSPVAGAQVSLAWRPTIGGKPQGPAIYRQATSGADGRFVLRGSPRGEVWVGVRARGFVPRAPSPYLAPPPDGREIEVHLERGATLAGRISTAAGGPVAGARVALGNTAGTSDAEGIYRVEGIEPGPTEIDLYHPHYRRLRRPVVVEPGANTLDLEVADGRRVAGRAVDEDGEPVAAARVSLEPRERHAVRAPQALTAADGTFELTPVADGDYGLEASAEGSAPVRRELSVRGEDIEEVELVFARGGAIAGRLLGLSAEQLARVAVRAESAELDRDRAGRVEAGGRFLVTDLTPGVWEIAATLPEEQRQVTARVLVAARRTAERDLEFKRRLTLSGEVSFDGDPLPEARVAVRAAEQALERSVVTGYDGTFRLEDLEPGTYRLGVSHTREMLVHNDTLALSGDREITIRLEPGSLAGEVADATTGAPVGGAFVELRPTAGAEFAIAGSSEESGPFLLPRVPPHRYRLTVRADGFTPHQREVEVVAGGGNPPQEVVLEPAPGLEVRVHLATGGVPTFLDLRAESPAGAVVAERRTVGPDGRVLLASLPTGPWKLTLGAPGAGLVRLAAVVPGDPLEVALPPAAPLVVEVPALAESERIGRVTLTDGQGGTLMVLEAGSVVQAWPFVGNRATLPAVPAGIWTVRVELPDGRRWQGTTTTDGQTAATVILE